jgi:hypothetical protein
VKAVRNVRQASKRSVFFAALPLTIFVATCDEIPNKTAPSTNAASASTGNTTDQQAAAALKAEIEREAQAIALAKEARNLVAGRFYSANVRPDPQTLTNDFQIRLQMSEVKGDINIIGWKAEQRDDDTYLVTYSYEYADRRDGMAHGWPFEVKLAPSVVRYVIEREHNI